MRAAALAREEDLHLRATVHHRRDDITAVRLHKGRGMSRKRLIEIYGRDLVDQALVGR